MDKNHDEEFGIRFFGVLGIRVVVGNRPEGFHQFIDLPEVIQPALIVKLNKSDSIAVILVDCAGAMHLEYATRAVVAPLLRMSFRAIANLRCRVWVGSRDFNACARGGEDGDQNSIEKSFMAWNMPLALPRSVE